jgi:hypothetical protein
MTATSAEIAAMERMGLLLPRDASAIAGRRPSAEGMAPQVVSEQFFGPPLTW